ncbi:MAG: tRNA1(Val) (adenine(37)-N6)-methyltransferase [Hyphomicrobium sp.]
MQDMTANPELTDDAFLGGALKLLQPRSGYRAGVDAVLLAAAVPALDGSHERLLDAGGGVGTVGLSVVRRCSGATAVLLERAPRLVELARENVERNGLGGRVQVFSGDLTASWSEMAGEGLAPESFDHVCANPPFNVDGHGTPSPDPWKSVAHSMPQGDLDLWGRLMARMAVPGGTATMIHKAEALANVIGALAGRFGGLRILPIYPRAGQPANRVIVQGTKGSRAPLVILPGFILHGEGNAFTPAADAILRDGAALELELDKAA